MHKGFTLIECVIAILLLTIVLVGGMAFYFYSYGNLQAATHRRMAMQVANAVLEGLKNAGYSNLPNPAPASPGLWRGPTNVAIGGLNGQENIYVFDVDDNGGGTDYKQVRVELIWAEPGRVDNQVLVLDTFIAPR
jgi:prepilin-type N-terminal cleavage/methylation domain-containing protein